MSTHKREINPETGAYYPLAYRKDAMEKRMSWSAVIAGTLTSIVIVLLLNLFGTGLGLAAVDPATEHNPLAGLATGAGIWWVFSNLSALFVGGWVAGHLSNTRSRKDNMIHGFLSWGLYTLLSAWLVTSAMGSILNGTGAAISKAVSVMGEGVKAATPEVVAAIDKQVNFENLTLQDIKEEVYQLLEDTDKQALDPQNLKAKARAVRTSARRNAEDVAYRPGKVDAQIEQIFRKAENKFTNSAEAIDKNALANVLADRTDMSKSEAMTAVNNWENQMQEVRREATAYVEEIKATALQQSEEIAEATSTAAFLTFFALLLGAITAIAGGAVGSEEYWEEYDARVVHAPETI